jgi:hypothetical protein
METAESSLVARGGREDERVEHRGGSESDALSCVVL